MNRAGGRYHPGMPPPAALAIALWTLAAGCGEERASAVEQRHKEVAAAPRAEPVLADQAIYAVVDMYRGPSLRPEVESTRRDSRMFVVLTRQPDAADYAAEEEPWSRGTGDDYLARATLRPVDAEPVTLVQTNATCVATATGLFLVRPSFEGAGGRELLEVDGCALPLAPLAIGGRHVEARRTEQRAELRDAAARAELARLGLEERADAVVHPLVSLRIDRYLDDLVVVTPGRPDPVAARGDSFDLAMYGETAYVLLGDKPLGVFRDFSGESLLEIGSRRFVVLSQATAGGAEYRVLEVREDGLTPILEVCDPALPGFFLSECNRPFTANPPRAR